LRSGAIFVAFAFVSLRSNEDAESSLRSDSFEKWSKEGKREQEIRNGKRITIRVDKHRNKDEDFHGSRSDLNLVE
jgi:hypothetical protein